MSARRSFDPAYEQKRRPVVPAALQRNVLLRFLGVVSPSLYMRNPGETDAYELALFRYLCYKRHLGRAGWRALHRRVRRQEREEAGDG